jgi:Mlc titration factor MtfA (ptsG expression regulator)
MTFQAIAEPVLPVYAEYDPSDEAEIQRMRERGESDGAILDEWSDQDSAEFIAARSEIFGQ